MQHFATFKHEDGETCTAVVTDLDSFWHAEEVECLVVDFGKNGESNQTLTPKNQLALVSLTASNMSPDMNNVYAG